MTSTLTDKLTSPTIGRIQFCDEAFERIIDAIRGAVGPGEDFDEIMTLLTVTWRLTEELIIKQSGVDYD